MTTPSRVLELLRTAPLAVASALGWVLGTAWAALVAVVSGVGLVVGTAYLALRTLAFALYYGFLLGAHIKLEPVPKRKPSILE